MDKHTLTKTTNPQNVLDYPNNNTFFLTWNLKEDLPVEELQDKRLICFSDKLESFSFK